MGAKSDQFCLFSAYLGVFSPDLWMKYRIFISIVDISANLENIDIDIDNAILKISISIRLFWKISISISIGLFWNMSISIRRFWKISISIRKFRKILILIKPFDLTKKRTNDMNIFVYSFVSKSIQMSHSGLVRRPYFSTFLAPFPKPQRYDFIINIGSKRQFLSIEYFKRASYKIYRTEIDFPI